MYMISLRLLFSLMLLISPLTLLKGTTEIPSEDDAVTVLHSCEELLAAVRDSDVQKVSAWVRREGINLTLQEDTHTQARTLAYEIYTTDCIAHAQPHLSEWMMDILEKKKKNAFAIIALIENHRSEIKEAQRATVELLAAAREGNKQKIDELLQVKGVHIDEIDSQKNTPLMHVCQRNSLPKNTPLSYVCQRGSLPMVQALLAAGATVNHQNSLGDTPLMIAARQGNDAVLDELIQAGALVDTLNEAHETAIMISARGFHLACVETLLNAGADFALMHTYLWNPLGFVGAAQQGHCILVQAFIAAGFNVNAQAGRNGDTALMVATQRDHIKIVRVLLKAGADVMIQSDDGDHAVLVAALNGHTEIIRTLITANSLSVNLSNSQEGHRTPLMAAAHFGHPEIIKILLDAGAESNAQDDWGDTALAHACLKGRMEVVAQLLQQPGINMHLTNIDGKTALEIAPEENKSMLEYLFKKYEEDNEVMIKPAAKRARIEETEDEHE